MSDRGPFRLANPDVDPGIFTAGILELLGDQDPLPILEALVPWLRDELETLDDDLLRQRPAPERWSVADVILHLTDHELVYRYRLRRMVAEPGYPLSAYDGNQWSVALRYADASVPHALDELEALRKANLAWLRTLDREERFRWGIHEERGEESVERVVRILAAHDLAHRGQIERIREAVEG